MAGEIKVPLGQIVFGPEEKEYLMRVIDTNRISYGPMMREFEEKLAELHDVKHAIFMASGTCALQVIMEALKEIYGWPDDSEVIIPATTFIATMSTVRDAGLIPVLAEVDLRTFNIDPESIKLAITDKTVAILPVHLLGQSADMYRIISIADEHNLRIIEDCCEAVGVRYQGQSVGSFGIAGAISTYVCHHITTGVGGAVLTSHDELATICRSLLQHGRDPSYLSLDDNSPGIADQRYSFVRWGHSYRATEMEAAIGLAQIRHVEENALKRLQIARMLSRRLAGVAGFLTLPLFDAESSPLFYPIITENESTRVGLVNHLEQAGIETRPIMPLLNQNPVKDMVSASLTFGEFVEHCKLHFPNNITIANNGFLIGCHQYMTKEHVERIGEVIDGYFSEAL